MGNFSGMEFGNKAAGFDAPVQLPRDEAEQRRWQAANKNWWESTPMRYDWRSQIAAPDGTQDYYREIDARFLSSVRKFMPWRSIPFDALIPFDELADKDVLEIGVGHGTHAQLIAQRCKTFTGIDLTAYASGMTGKRLRLFGIPGMILQMDAERMAFANDSFDHVWSWGVIHHSANTRRVLEEMNRVLRPGGRATVMVYSRSWWHFYVCGFLRGAFRNGLRSMRSFHHLAQAATDGGRLARGGGSVFSCRLD
jgi:SAM-dependent methyltransferase